MKMRMLGRFFGFHETNHVGFNKANLRKRPKLLYLTVAWFFIVSVLILGHPSFARSAVFWSDDFESGGGDWAASKGTWEVGIPSSGPGNAYSGEQCAATVLDGNYSEPVESRFIRWVSFTVPDASDNPRLRFWHWYSFSTSDYGKVQIKEVGTDTWTDISPQYTSTGSGVWTYPFIDLSDYAGLTVQIGFYFYSVQYSYYANVSSGWYIDDVEVITGDVVFISPEDWESGIDDWSAGRGTWEVGIPSSGPGSAYSGEQCAATVLDGNYSEPVSSMLKSPQFVVPDASESPRLRFWHWYSFSTSDYGKVQIKEVGTDTWTDISPQYTSTGSGVWTYPFIDLSDYAGLTVQIGFYFYSVQYSYYANVSSGWYIDDVEVITGDVVFISPEDWESGIDDWSAGRGTWEVGIPSSGPGSAYSGEQCAATVLDGNYSEPVSSMLKSPQFVVPDASESPRLRFWHWYSFSTSDYGKVQIKEVGTDTWTDISPQYTSTGSGVWTYPFIDLSDYAGLTVQIGFYFYSVQYSYYANVSSGWYIDDVTIEPLPDLPVINSLTATPNTINKGGSATLSWDVDGATSAAIDNGVGPVDPSSGSVQVSPADTTTYTLTATNANGSVTKSTTVTVENLDPVAIDDQATTQEDTPVTINVVSNDTDPNGTVDPTTVTIVSDASNGTTTNNGDGTVTYTPDTGFAGTDTFTYTVDDDEGATSNEATVTVTVNPVIQPPVANDDQATTQEDTSVTINVVGNDTDADGDIDPTTVAIVTDASNGATTNNGDGTVTYTPDTGFAGTDTFTYTVDDDEGATSNEATVTVTVNPVNQPPVANDDQATTQQDTSVTINVVSNDTDPDGTVDPTTVAIVTDASNGATTNNGDGTVTYTPDTGFAGTDTFTYTVDDDEGATSNEATVTVTVNPVIQPPVANDDQATTQEDTSVNINVVSNDDDPDGTVDPTTVAIVTDASNGATTNNGDGTVTYTPDTGFAGTDTFTYTVDDDEGATSNEATVTVTVNPVIQPPVANDDQATTQEDTSVTINVVGNDTDADGDIDPTTVAIVTDAGNGTTTNNGDGTVTYTPDTGFIGTDTFKYTVDDDGGATSNEATVIVTVAWPPQPPVANNDTAMTDQDIPVTINVVSNDTDADGTIDPATVTIVSWPTDGTVVNNGDGTVTYTPDSGFTGTDSFTYTVKDNEGATSNQATVVVSVGAAKTICPYLGDHLFAGFSSFLDCDAFTFNGEEGEEVIIKLEEDPLGAYTGENAVLVCESPIDVSLFKINRKFWLTETERGDLPLEIIFALPTAGQYRIKVGQSLFRRKDGRFYFGDRFKGDYCLTLGSSGAAWQTLEPTSYPPTTKVE